MPQVNRGFSSCPLYKEQNFIQVTQFCQSLKWICRLLFGLVTLVLYTDKLLYHIQHLKMSKKFLISLKFENLYTFLKDFKFLCWNDLKCSREAYLLQILSKNALKYTLRCKIEGFLKFTEKPVNRVPKYRLFTETGFSKIRKPSKR